MSTKLIGTWQGWIRIIMMLAVAVLIATGVYKLGLHYGGHIPGYYSPISFLFGVVMLCIAFWFNARERNKPRVRKEH